MTQKLHLYNPLADPNLKTQLCTISPDQKIIIGRSDESILDLSIYVTDWLLKISRTHFEIFYESSQFFINDISRHGTYIHSHRLPKKKPIPLYDDDEIILLGDTPEQRLVFRVAYASNLPPERTEEWQPPPDPTLLPIQENLNKLNDMMLLGPAGSGKTTLLYKIRPETRGPTQPSLPEDRFFRFCYFDCLNLVDTNPDAPLLSSTFFFQRILNSIIEFLGGVEALPSHIQRQVKTLPAIDNANKNQSTSKILRTIADIAQTVYIHEYKRVALLLDHLDTLYPQLSSQIYLDLVELKHLAKSALIYVIALQNELDRGSKQARKFFRAINMDWMSLFDDRQLKRLIGQHYSGGRPDFIEEIKVLGGCRPRLTQLVAELMDGFEPNDEYLSRLLTNEEIQIHCQEIWESLQEDEQRVLRLASSGTVTSLPPQLYDRLVNKKAILQGSKKNYTFVSPLFAAYVNSLLSVEPGQSGIHPNKERHGAVVNGVFIQLTPLEMKVFLYLYNNKEVTCLYENILSAVWGWGEAEKADKGPLNRVIKDLRGKFNQVSDSAGDYIENVRGVGYRFVKE